MATNKVHLTQEVRKRYETDEKRAMDPDDDCGYQVELFVYDLTKGLARTLSPALLGKQIDGVWHTGVVAYGREYFFGSAGIESCKPGGTVLGEPDRIEALGESQVPYQLFLEYIFGLGESAYRPGAYDLLKHNCNNFSDDISQFLCGRGVPKAILQLPEEVLNTPLGLTLNDALKKVELKHANSRSINFGPLGSTIGPAIQLVRSSYDDPEFDELNDAIDQVRHNSVILEERRNSLNDKLSKKERKERRREKRERKEKRRKERSETSEERRQRKKKSKPPLPPSESFVSESGEGQTCDRSRNRQRSHASESSDTAPRSGAEPSPNLDADLNTTVESVNHLRLADEVSTEQETPTAATTTTTWEAVDDFWGNQTDDTPSGPAVDDNTSTQEEGVDPPAAYADPSDNLAEQGDATDLQTDYNDTGADMENSAPQDTAEQQAPPSPLADSGAESQPEVEREPPILFKDDVDVSNHGTNTQGSRGVSVDSNPSPHPRSRSLTPVSLAGSPAHSPVHDASSDLISQSPHSESSLCLMSMDVCLSSCSGSSNGSDLSSASPSPSSSQEDLSGSLDPAQEDPNNNSFDRDKQTELSTEMKNVTNLIPATIGKDDREKTEDHVEETEIDAMSTSEKDKDLTDTNISQKSIGNLGVIVGEKKQNSDKDTTTGSQKASVTSKPDETEMKSAKCGKENKNYIKLMQPNLDNTSNNKKKAGPPLKNIQPNVATVPEAVTPDLNKIEGGGIQLNKMVATQPNNPLNVGQLNPSTKVLQTDLIGSPKVQSMPAKSPANFPSTKTDHIETIQAPITQQATASSQSASKARSIPIKRPLPPVPTTKMSTPTKVSMTTSTNNNMENSADVTAHVSKTDNSTPTKTLQPDAAKNTIDIPIDAAQPSKIMSVPSKTPQPQANQSSDENKTDEATSETSSPKKIDVVLRKDLAKNIEDFLRRTSAEEQNKRYSYPIKIESSTAKEDSEAERCKSMSPSKVNEVPNVGVVTKSNPNSQVNVGQATKKSEKESSCFLSEETGISNSFRVAGVSGEKVLSGIRPPSSTANKTHPNTPQGYSEDRPVRMPNSAPRFSRYPVPANAGVNPNGNRNVRPGQFRPQTCPPPPPYDRAVDPRMGPEYDQRGQVYMRPAYNPRAMNYDPRVPQGPRAAGYDPRTINNPGFVRAADERAFRPVQGPRDTGQARPCGPSGGPAFRQPGVSMHRPMGCPGPRPQPVSLYYDAQGRPVGPWVYPTPRMMGPDDNGPRQNYNPQGNPTAAAYQALFHQDNPNPHFQDSGRYNMDPRFQDNRGAVPIEKPVIKTSANAPKKPPRSNQSSNSSLESSPGVTVILNPNDGVAPAPASKTTETKFYIHPPEYYGRRSQERGSSFSEDDQGSSVDCDSDVTQPSTEQYPTSHDSSSSSLCRSSTASSTMSFGSSYYMLYVVDPIERPKTPEDHLSSPETSPTPGDSSKDDAFVTCADTLYKSDSTSSVASFRTITPDPEYFDDNDKAFRELRGLSQTSSGGSFGNRRSHSEGSGFTLRNSNSSNDHSMSNLGSEDGITAKRSSGRSAKKASSQPTSPVTRHAQLSRACSLESLSSLLRRIPRTPSPFSSLSTLDLIVPSMSNSPPSVSHHPDRPPSTDSPIMLAGADGAARGSQDSLVLYRPVPRYPPNSGTHSASPEPLPTVLCYLAPARPLEQPLVFPQVYLEARRDFEELVGCCMPQLAAEEQKHMEELRAYVVEDDGAWALGENFGDLFARIFDDPNIPDKARYHLVRILAVAALKDDVILLLHQDRKDHTIMNFANKIEHLTPDLQEAIALFFCNMFEHISPSEWLLYISEWNPEGSMPISNIRVTTKVAVNALLHSNAKVQEYGTAIMYNLGTKEVKTVVFDDVAPELAMAILQFFNTNPKEELLWRTITALCRFCYASSEVPSLIKMIGPEPSNFKGKSERIDTAIEEINAKLSRVRLF